MTIKLYEINIIDVISEDYEDIIKIIVFGKVFTKEIISQSSSTWEETFRVGCPSYKKKYVGSEGDSTL